MITEPCLKISSFFVNAATNLTKLPPFFRKLAITSENRKNNIPDGVRKGSFDSGVETTKAREPNGGNSRSE